MGGERVLFTFKIMKKLIKEKGKQKKNFFFFQKWLFRTCKENNWHHIHSPLIWKEVSMKKGKKYFVGKQNV